MTIDVLTYDVVNAMARAAFEDENRARSAVGIRSLSWEETDRSFQDVWRSRQRAANVVLQRLMETP